MGVLFVATAVAFVALLLAAYVLWRGRFGRARFALARRDEAEAQGLRAARTVLPGRTAPRQELPFPFSYVNRRLRQGGISMSVQGVVLAAAIGAVACWKSVV